MVTTRDMEHQLEQALVEAGASEDNARAAAEKLGDEVVQLATKSDLDEGLLLMRTELNDSLLLMRTELNDSLLAMRQELDERLLEMRREFNEALQEMRRELKEDNAALRRDLTDRHVTLERTVWRLAMLGFGMWSATFGALLYAVFG